MIDQFTVLPANRRNIREFKVNTTARLGNRISLTIFSFATIKNSFRPVN